MQNIGQRSSDQTVSLLPVMQEVDVSPVSSKSNTPSACIVKVETQVVRISAKELYCLLSVRDREIVDGLLQGKSIPEIAKDLPLKRGTVKQRMMRLGCQLGYKYSNQKLSISLAKMFIDVLELEQQPLPVSIQTLCIHYQKRESMTWHFTSKEIGIVRQVVVGKLNKDIASSFSQHEQVIKNYLRGIYDKTGCSTRLELMIWYEAHRVALKEPAPIPVMLELKLDLLMPVLRLNVMNYVMYGVRV